MTVPTLISRFFEPLLILTVITLIGAVHGGLTGQALATFIILFIGVIIAPPVGYLLWLLKTKKISNWDITVRKQRVKPLLVLIGLSIVDGILITQFQVPILNRLMQVYLLWIIGFFLITLKWKLSGHVGVTTLASGLIILWFGWEYWPLLVTIPIISWARVKGKYHTVGQVILGAAYSAGILALATAIF